jgi:hypothetical protein
MAETVRIDPKTHAKLKKLARAKHLSLTEALARAVEAYRREVFLHEMQTGYAALQEDADGWSEELKERGAWEPTTADGLEDE